MDNKDNEILESGISEEEKAEEAVPEEETEEETSEDIAEQEEVTEEAEGAGEEEEAKAEENDAEALGAEEDGKSGDVIISGDVIDSMFSDEEESEEEKESPKKKELPEFEKPTSNLLCSFDYNVKNKEEEEAFLIFQRKYVYKHNWIVTVAFGAVALLFLISIIRNPSGYLNYVLCFICLVMIFATWFNTVRIRKYLMSALKDLEDDKYRFTLYDDCFMIETLFTEEEMAEEDFIPVRPRIVKFDDISLNIIENKDMFILILKKETIYVLSKRVISDEDQKLLKDKFSAVLGEDYEIMQ